MEPSCGADRRDVEQTMPVATNNTSTPTSGSTNPSVNVSAKSSNPSRLDRIPGLEEAIYVKGCNQFADQVAELDPRTRLTIAADAQLSAYERQFRKLQIQEMRLHRLREKLVAELKQLQKEREQRERDELATADS